MKFIDFANLYYMVNILTNLFYFVNKCKLYL